MIKFEILTLRNFVSFGAVTETISLDRNSPILISGRNGAGKSTVINAIVYAIYDKPISDISKDNLINKTNKKDMEVTLTFTTKNKNYKIIRARKSKDGNYVKLIENDKDITPDSIKNANILIEKIVGMPFEMFIRIAAVSATHTPFLNLPVRSSNGANQSDIIEELFDITIVSEKADILKEHIKVSEQQLTLEHTKNEQIEKELERYDAQLNSAKKRINDWDEENTLNILALEQKMKKIEGIDIIGQQKIFNTIEEYNENIRAIESEAKDLMNKKEQKEKELVTYTTQLKNTEQELKKWNVNHQEEIESYTNKLSKLEDINIQEQKDIFEKLGELLVTQKQHTDSIKSFTTEYEDLTTNIENLESELTHLKDAKCPYCLQQFKDAKTKIKEKEISLGESKKTLTSLIANIDNTKNTLKETEEKINENKKFLVLPNMDALMEVKEKVGYYKKQLENLEVAENPFNGQYDNLIKNNIEKETTKEIKNLTKELNTVVKTITTLENKKTKTEKELVVDNIEELLEIKEKMGFNKKQLKTLKTTTNPFKDPLDELIAAKPDGVDLGKINELTDTIDHQKFLLKLLTKKDSFVRKALLHNNIPYLNQRLSHYLSELELPHHVEFTHEMTAKISQFGRVLDFGNLSTGQRARVNLALSFSFRDVLQKLHGSINLCILDEVLDVGLDSVGVTNAAKMLKRKATDEKIGLFIISHRDEIDGMFDNNMLIKMEHGFTSIEERS